MRSTQTGSTRSIWCPVLGCQVLPPPGKVAAQNKHGRIWAPMDPQWSMAGITFTSEERVFADDACMGEQSFGSDGWSEVLQAIRNRLMHAITGNRMSFVSFLFLVLSLAMAVGCAVLCVDAVRFDLRFVINLCCCIFSLQCAMTLNAKRKSFKPPMQCRFVSRRRLKSVHNWNHRVSRSKWLVKGLCICSPFAMLCIRASVLVTMKHDNMMYKSGSVDVVKQNQKPFDAFTSRQHHGTYEMGKHC